MFVWQTGGLENSFNYLCYTAIKTKSNGFKIKSIVNIIIVYRTTAANTFVYYILLSIRTIINNIHRWKYRNSHIIYGVRFGLHIIFYCAPFEYVDNIICVYYQVLHWQ